MTAGSPERHTGWDARRALLTLWGKSGGPGRPPHLLLQHLYDAAAVGELIWDRFMADGLRQRLDQVTRGQGRAFLALLCGIHDVGKATPLFQAQDADLAQRVRDAGLHWRNLSRIASGWHHTRAGAAIIRTETTSAGWGRYAREWVWPIVAGHHGEVPAKGATQPSSANDDHGTGDRWRVVQALAATSVVRALGFSDLASAAPVGRPSRGDQLALLGLVIVADWVASNQAAFEPVDDPLRVEMALARSRADQGWRQLELAAGWRPPSSEGDLIHARFQRAPRPLQLAVERMAERMVAPGLLVIEAPMGEGKTEAALAAAEILAHRFGARGLFVGMPTQATSDPMFHRVLAWSAAAAPGIPIALLHGKRQFNPEWRRLVGGIRIQGVDDDASSEARASGPSRENGLVAEWFLGAKRGLLTPLAIGTIDQLLLAGSRIRHVMLRHAGLAEKVVVLDEVHAATVYMAQFLMEALRWLASAGTPVILLTATLPPGLRQDVVGAYLEGAATAANTRLSPEDCPAAGQIGYPGALSVTFRDGTVVVDQEAAEPWRPPVDVSLRFVSGLDEDGMQLAAVLETELAAGGCALVIRNTVDAAQRTFVTLQKRFGNDVELLHGRLTAAERARRAECEVRLLGPDPTVRPFRHILVATQVAEQSFDIDVDLLITDLAPMDLLLQRIGRLHRHDNHLRPAPLAVPRVVVVGWTPDTVPPTFSSGSRHIYRSHRLLRTAALLLEARGNSWRIPTDVPELVAKVYGSDDIVPSAWADAARDAWRDESATIARLKDLAEAGLLSPRAKFAAATLEDLSRLGERADDDLGEQILVREGMQSAEAVLVRMDGGDHLTLTGRRITTGGVLTTDGDVIEEVMGSLVRLPMDEEVARAVTRVPVPPAWLTDPLLGTQRPLALDGESRGSIGGFDFRYDERLGVVATTTERRLNETN